MITWAEVRSAIAKAAAAASAGDARWFGRALDEEGVRLRAWLLSLRVNGAPEDLAGTYVTDAFTRFLHTLKMIPMPAPRRILEIGSNPYFFHSLLVRLFHRSEITGSNFFDHDIFSKAVGRMSQRVESSIPGSEDATFESVLFNVETVSEWPFPAESFDLVLFCETLEHLAVDPLPVFSKAWRVVAPGGHVLVTLPNAVRLSNVALMLEGANVFDIYHPANSVYGRHNREFTLDEMRRLLAASGFRVVLAETRDRFEWDRMPFDTLDYAGPSRPLRLRRADVLKILKRCGGRLTDRGDNLYLLAKKEAGARPAAGESSSEAVRHFIDAFEEAETTVHVLGWALLSTPEGAAVPTDVTLRFDGPGDVQRAETARALRLDLAQTFGLERDDSGFEPRVSTRGWPPGRYRLSLEVAREDGASETVRTNYGCRVG